MTCLRLLRLDIVATVGVTQHSTHQGGYCAEPGCARLRVSGGGLVHLPSAPYSPSTGGSGLGSGSGLGLGSGTRPVRCSAISAAEG